MDEILKEALSNNEKMELSDFAFNIRIVHLDGSIFDLKGAVSRISNVNPKFLIVYREHGLPITFYIDDLAELQEVKR